MSLPNDPHSTSSDHDSHLHKVNLAKVKEDGFTKLVHTDHNVTPNVEMIYCSKEISTLSTEDIGTIINIANAESRRRGVSSMLCFAGGHFIQLLEGNGEEVNALYREVALKTSYNQIQMISFKVTDQNSFAKKFLGNQGDTKIVCYDGKDKFIPNRFNHDQAIDFLSDIINKRRFCR